VKGPLRFQTEMRTAAGGPCASLERLVRTLLDEIARGADPLLHPLVSAGLAEAMVRALLLEQPHDHTHLLARAPRPAEARVVRRVEEHLDARAGEPLQLAELAALTGPGLAAIDAGLRAHRGTTAREFLRRRRLGLARRRLLEPEGGATAAEAAGAAGFLRRERFDAAYAAQFGESPAETRRRAHRPRATAPVTEEVRAAEPGQPVVFVVDEDPARSRARRRVLEGAGHAVQAHPSARAFLAAARSARAGCAVVELHLSDLDGPALQAALAEAGCALPLIFTAGEAGAREAVAVMKGGAVDLLLGPSGDDELLAAVARALGHDAAARAAAEEQDDLDARYAQLSPREREVCERMGRGLLNKQIAGELGISERTVKAHRARVMERLGASSAAEVARLLEKLGRK
jgi:FixJ family two-component response regulator/AraC-like DNA-binding protein